MSMDIELGPQTEGSITELIETGRFSSRDEVLREGVRLVHEREARLRALDVAITRGLADADAGRTKPAREVFDRLQAKYDAMRAAPPR